MDDEKDGFKTFIMIVLAMVGYGLLVIVILSWKILTGMLFAIFDLLTFGKFRRNL